MHPRNDDRVGVMELADVTDSKSVGSDTVRVQVPPPAPYADMAELADALDSGSSDFTVIQVQVLLSAPYGRVPEWPKGADCKSVA